MKTNKIENLADRLTDNTSTEGWIANGNVLITYTEDKESNECILVNNINTPHDFINMEIKSILHKGKNYYIVVWLKICKGQPNDIITLSISYKYPNNKDCKESIICKKEVTSEWIKLEGTYYCDYGNILESAYINIKSDGIAEKYSLDNVNIIEQRIGLFNLLDASLAKDLNVQATRFIASDYLLKKELILLNDTNNNADTLNEKTKAFIEVNKEGVPIVLSIIWPNKNSKYHRIPEGRDRIEALEFIKEFLLKVGPYISIYSLNNEPDIDNDENDKKYDENHTIKSIEWMKELAAASKEVINNNPEISHLKISSHGFLIYEKMKREMTIMEKDFLKAQFDWINNDKNVDFADVHLHVGSVDDMENTIDYMQKHTNKPLICTEWSQAGELDNWIEKKTNKIFADKWGIDSQLTNEEFVRLCYKEPVTKEQWDDFIKDVPLDSTFMQVSATTAISKSMIMILYGQYRQFGAPRFDVKQLFASKTVVSGIKYKYHENYDLVKQFQFLRK